MLTQIKYFYIPPRQNVHAQKYSGSRLVCAKNGPFFYPFDYQLLTFFRPESSHFPTSLP